MRIRGFILVMFKRRGQQNGKPCLYINWCILPHENGEYFVVAGDDDDEGDEEDLTVEYCVVEVSPLDRGETHQQVLCLVSHNHWAGQILKEVDSGALVEVLVWVLENPEDDGLGGGEDEGEDPGHTHHHSGSCPLLLVVQGREWIADADIPEI